MDVIPELSASHMEDDKKRGKNYTAYEKELLLEILKGNHNNKKQEAWDRVTTEYNSHENVAKREKANLKSLWKNLKIKATDKKEILKIGGGGPAEPMDKMSEGIIDLLPNQFAAIENEFDEDYILERGGSSRQSHETATKSAASTPSTSAEAPSIFVLKTGKKGRIHPRMRIQPAKYLQMQTNFIKCV
ncbi:upf0439 protein c9orf30 [Plakobranchus ocellatus]|uniref:Upf0439 protein c9orf30 n=1 Tax=Plakobranchus ocellatus TaxID=259542 RepID=A0AAV3YBF1_9GAST|nr:upf0439 protein c9orf30 [Plakobranchus ocellatus]